MKTQKKILILDDDVVSGTLLKQGLSCDEYKCTFVTEVEDCFSMIEKEDFDILLLDIVMPKMSGYEVLKEIRKNKSSFELPVIMVTAKEETEDIVNSLQKGANDYLIKPVNVEVAKARIKTLVNLKELHRRNLNHKQIDTINKMVTTLNHEINNPLAIAIGNLTILGEYYSGSEKESKKVDKALLALERITEIVKKIDSVSKGEIEEIRYSENINMFKL